jgi:hypothetical protein
MWPKNNENGKTWIESSRPSLPLRIQGVEGPVGAPARSGPLASTWPTRV